MPEGTSDLDEIEPTELNIASIETIGTAENTMTLPRLLLLGLKLRVSQTETNEPHPLLLDQ